MATAPNSHKVMTINGIIENQIVNHNTVNGKTNREMYRTANRVCYDTFWFSERGLATKGNPFTKANNYTVAYLDNAESGEIDHWIKIDNTWYYVTKEQLTNLFDPNYEGTDDENENYMEDNISSSEEIRTDILNNVQRIIINGFYERWFTITNINGYELLMKIFQYDDCVSLTCCIDNKENNVCLVSCDEYCEHTLHLKDYTKEELYDTITEYFYNKYCLFTYMLGDIKDGVMTESANCYNYGFEFAGDCEEAFSTMCAAI